MRYKAELFDKLQYAFEETKFNDHQLHCIIEFEGRIKMDIMEKAIVMLYEVNPLLSCNYVHNGGDAYWEMTEMISPKTIFKKAENKVDFDQFTTSKIDETKGGQVKFCLHRSTYDSLSVIMNHMLCDAAGFKECLYLLAEFYSKLVEDFRFTPDFVIEGDRSIRGVMLQFSSIDKIKALLFRNSESNKKSHYQLPMSMTEIVEPFILTYELLEGRYQAIRACCKKYKVTLNDVVLTAYYRVISKMLNADGKPLNIPIMIDMRKGLKDKDPQFLTNLSSTVITSLTVASGETFEETLIRLNNDMNLRKKNQMGLNGFVKLAWLHKIFGNSKSYSIIKNNLMNPNIFMTNIGILDSERLAFKGTNIKNAFMCGSIKYRPHFQVALTSFNNKITLSSNLYGSTEDRQMIQNFFELLDQELPD